MSQLPIYTKVNLLSDVHVYTFLLALFSLGIGIGSILCNVLLKGEISSKFVPITIILMTFCIIDIVLGSNTTSVVTTTTQLGSLSEFLSTFSGIRLTIDFLLLSMLGGLYVVPLQAIIQTASDIKSRSQTIAANNVINSLFMVLGSVASTLILVIGFGIEHVFIVLAVANIFVAIYTCKLLPDHLLRAIFKTVLQFIYHVEIQGLENYKKLGKRSVIIANHVSFLDPILIAIFLPDKPLFAVNTFIAQNRFFKPFLRAVKTYPIDPTNSMAIKSLVEQVRSGNKLVIFPEGRITTTGSLMKIYSGSGIIADKTGADILPICIEGAEYSLFSRFAKRIKKIPNAKIVLKILPPVRLKVADSVTGHKRRQALTDEIYKIMLAMKYGAENINRDLFENLINSARRYGFRHKIVDDMKKKPWSYRKLIFKSFALGRVLEMFAGDARYVGIMLPNTKICLLTLLGLIAHKKVPVMLNCTTGVNNLLQACLACQVETIFTSRGFIGQEQLEAFEDALLGAGKRIFYLEDLQHEISPLDKIVATCKAFFPDSCYLPAKPDEPAVVLLTSGASGQSKCVVLSHKNIISNINQIICSVDTSTNDLVLNTLPIFNSFGLTGGTLLPLYFGIKIFLYPSPQHYRIIPELAYDINATILFGMDTLLAGYAEIAHPYDFYSLRFVFATAEKLQDETRKLWVEKFGVRIFEGYGTAETSSIVALNTPLYNRKGTVGQLITGIQYRLEKVPGITDGFRLFIKGPNVMLGYLEATNPGVIEPPQDNWYDTGDVVSIDDDGFVTIKGRATA
jgi:acyl-[acyl-carrier-protein]-phospholipid O-acyltransferase/long-chain-fatty-acid--[acyl-carrier-protein] ligase